ncbi:hypothetical protein BSIN_3463 [Burkholderia singularis]|uniref:Uncharacterized protein n=1 Tax=Burkholderia singularis TaxID=1503053 RepID=A0A238HCH7_9BURK|nr:hypothetical protein BSIN_3463 [Burkholderia singularis]
MHAARRVLRAAHRHGRRAPLRPPRSAHYVFNSRIFAASSEPARPARFASRMTKQPPPAARHIALADHLPPQRHRRTPLR